MSDEIKAQQKYNCPSCGAAAQWNPAKQALVCPYCGTISPAKINAEGKIEEHDLAVAIRAFKPDERGLATQKKAVKCQSCQAITMFDANRAAQRCDFCGSAAIIPIDEQERPIRPESLLEFKISETQVRETIRQWYGARWFAPNKLGTRALTDTVHGIYIPFWTFDAQVGADWTAESGDYYNETEYYTDDQGRQQSRTVQKVRWYSTSGHVDHFFDDDLVPATKGVEMDLLQQIGTFPTTTDLKPYDPGYVSGWVVEQYQIDLVAAAQTAQAEMEEMTRQLCDREVPGDTHRSLEVQADFSGQTFKHILVPVWLLAYTYGSQNFQVVINGYTGEIAGRYPKSWVKILLLVLLIIAVIGGIIWATQRR